MIGAFEYTLTVGELLTAIFDELAFHGTPSERGAFLKELQRRVQEVESGRAKLAPWKKVKEQLNARRATRRGHAHRGSGARQ